MKGCSRYQPESQRLLLVLMLWALLSAKTAHGFTPLALRSHKTLIHPLRHDTPASIPLISLQAKGDAGVDDDDGDDNNDDDDDDDEWITAEISEVIVNDIDKEEEEEWITDREKAIRKREMAYAYQEASAGYTQKTSKRPTGGDRNTPGKNMDDDSFSRASPYTEEEEEVIRSMGGKANSPSKRQPGYLGDSTLAEIATDYSVPVCYLADVLCMWGVPVPIDIHDRLGDLVTGEQAFSILEAVNSIDVAALHDRYSNQSLLQVCSDWDIDLSEGFEMAMKEGWSLPFGVQTVLRVEQEEELLRVLGGHGVTS